jgi:hypothetical protein
MRGNDDRAVEMFSYLIGRIWPPQPGWIPSAPHAHSGSQTPARSIQSARSSPRSSSHRFPTRLAVCPDRARNALGCGYGRRTIGLADPLAPQAERLEPCTRPSPTPWGAR